MYYRYFGVDSNALSLVVHCIKHGWDAMAIENESKNEDLYLGSVPHNDQDKSDTVKREEARLALKT